MMLGGRVAEKLIFNEYTTGAANDLERVTDLTRKMICEWGMNEEMGPVTFGKKDQEIFLGREIAQHRDYSEETAQKIDAEVKRVIMEAHKKAEELLTRHIDDLHALAKALLVYEILDGEQIDQVLKGEPIDSIAFTSDANKVEKEVKSDKKAKNSKATTDVSDEKKEDEKKSSR